MNLQTFDIFLELSNLQHILGCSLFINIQKFHTIESQIGKKLTRDLSEVTSHAEKLKLICKTIQKVTKNNFFDWR